MTTDIDGEPRPFGAGFDIGADEFVAGVWMSPRTRGGQGARGDDVVYYLSLLNATQKTDRFLLDAAGNAWTTTLSITDTGPLTDGAVFPFSVTVAVPIDAPWYATDAVTISATSIASPTVYSATARITTEAYAPPKNHVSPEALVSTQYANESVTQTLTISNTGTSDLSFDLGAPVHGAQYIYHFDEASGAASFQDSSGNGLD